MECIINQIFNVTSNISWFMIFFFKLLSLLYRGNRLIDLKDRPIHRSETQVIVQVSSKLKLVLNVTKLSIPILIKPRMFARRVICEVDKRVRCGTSYRKLVVHTPISTLSRAFILSATWCCHCRKNQLRKSYTILRK